MFAALFVGSEHTMHVNHDILDYNIWDPHEPTPFLIRPHGTWLSCLLYKCHMNRVTAWLSSCIDLDRVH